MSTNKENLLARLQALRDDYVRDYPERMRQLSKSWKQYQKHLDPEVLTTLYRQAHSLKGSGATFQFNDVSTHAAQLDSIASSLIEQETQLNDGEKNQIDILIDKLCQLDLDTSNPESSQFNVTTENEKSNTLMLVSNDDELCKELEGQLSNFDFKLVVIDKLTEFDKLVGEFKPATIIMQIQLADGVSGLDAIRDYSTKHGKNNTPPVIYISNIDDINTRIKAVRNNGVKFMQQPVKTAELIDILAQLSNIDYVEPYRILIIDDTESLSSYYQATLQSVKMSTCIVNNPLNALQKLIEFNPELILMDMYMPECSGQELATVIRQHEAYVSIPIVYLSSELNTDKQLEAMRHGGDDFLTKPIDPSHLIAAVETRTNRYRQLRSFMVRDSLTGLYNHTKTTETLEHDLLRYERIDGNLVYAMIDIDKFKSVNDKFGHPVGDIVIKSLAQLLKQRLRRSDTIGRYGGEEFAAILYDTDIENAVTIMNSIREDFANMVHRAGDIEFHSSFSCGLASYPAFDTAKKLNAAADKAMYKAKQQGRNQVSVASSSKK